MKSYSDKILFKTYPRKNVLDVDIGDLRGSEEAECSATLTGHASHGPTAATWDCVGGAETEPTQEQTAVTLAAMARSILAVAMAGATMLDKHRRLYVLAYVFAPSICGYTSITELSKALGMSRATCWRLTEKVKREMGLIAKAQ